MSASSSAISRKTSERVAPQKSADGWKLEQIAGRSGLPKSWQRLSSARWIHLVPAGLPSGIPGIGEEMEIAMQHAPQFVLHSIALTFLLWSRVWRLVLRVVTLEVVLFVCCGVKPG